MDTPNTTSIDGRRLLVQIAAAVLVLCGANAVVSRLSENSVPRQTLRHGESIRPATDIFIGNSTMAAGIDEAVFAGATGGRPLNLGLGSTSPVEHYLLLRQQPVGPTSNVFYGFFDTQLTDPVVGDWDTLIGNRSMSYYVDPEVAVGFYAHDHAWSARKLRLIGRVPYLVERFAIWSKVEIARRAMDRIGMPRQEINRFGRAADFALLEMDVAEFTKRCGGAVEDNTAFSAPIAAFVNHVEQAGAKLYFIEMPMKSSHRSRYYTSRMWQAYRTRIENLLHQSGAEIIVASDWCDDSNFADNLHLNAAGAERFSRRLAKSVEERRAR